jgi:hypothetical protein
VAGSLSYSRGVLYVGSEERAAHVRSFDLDGRELDAGFSFRGADGGAASVTGLAVDEDHRLWVADGVGGELRAFTLFGDQVAGVSSAQTGQHDKGGVLGTLADVASRGSDDAQELLVASAGRRRHAVQILPLGSGPPRSLRCGGQVDSLFKDVTGVAWQDSLLWVCERGRGRVQVFREEDYHFSFALPNPEGAPFQPTAVSALEDGRLVLAQGGVASAVRVLSASGKPLHVLAGTGAEEGCVREPSDLIVVPGEDDSHTLVVVIDGEGTRVQVFNLEGNCYGTFPGFAGSDGTWGPA